MVRFAGNHYAYMSMEILRLNELALVLESGDCFCTKGYSALDISEHLRRLFP